MCSAGCEAGNDFAKQVVLYTIQVFIVNDL